MLSLTTCVAVEGNHEISLLQGIWIQVSVGASGVLQALHHISGLLLVLLQFFSVFSVLGSPELDTVLEKWPRKSGVKRITTTSLSLLATFSRCCPAHRQLPFLQRCITNFFN